VGAARSIPRVAAAQANSVWGAGLVREKDDDWWQSRRQGPHGDARASTPDSMAGAHGGVLRLADRRSARAQELAQERREERQQWPPANHNFYESGVRRCSRGRARGDRSFL
jgi:hypothetical protein